MAEVQNNLRYRMYGLVPYNISPIQQGIQFGHGVVEYLVKNPLNREVRRWATVDKTFIILNGGTTNVGYQGNCKGTLNQHLDTLIDAGIEVSTFYEPDLGDQLTSVNFLVDERVWDKEKYPDFTFTGEIYEQEYEYWLENIGGEKIAFLRDFLKKFRLA